MRSSILLILPLLSLLSYSAQADEEKKTMPLARTIEIEGTENAPDLKDILLYKKRNFSYLESLNSSATLDILSSAEEPEEFLEQPNSPPLLSVEEAVPNKK